MSGKKVVYSQSPARFLGPIFKLWTMSSADMLKWNPIYNYLTTSSGQYGLINIRHGESSDAAVERELVEDVAGYGKQLGRLLDAASFLAKHLSKDDKQIAKHDAVKALLELSEEIEDRKTAISKRNNLTLTKLIDDLATLKSKDETAFREFCAQLQTAIARQD